MGNGLKDPTTYCNVYFYTHAKQNHSFKAYINFDIKLDQPAKLETEI